MHIELKLLVIYFKGRVTGRGARERQRREVFHLLAHPQMLTIGRAGPGARRSIQVSLRGVRDQVLMPSPAAPYSAHLQEIASEADGFNPKALYYGV